MKHISVENLIIVSKKHIEDPSKGLSLDGKVNKKYRSYISSLGPTIRQSGLIKAILSYSRKDSESEKFKIIELIESILKEEGIIEKSSSLINVCFEAYKKRNENFIEFINLENYIKKTIIAIKLSMNLFELIDE